MRFSRTSFVLAVALISQVDVRAQDSEEAKAAPAKEFKSPPDRVPLSSLLPPQRGRPDMQKEGLVEKRAPSSETVVTIRLAQGAAAAQVVAAAKEKGLTVTAKRKLKKRRNLNLVLSGVEDVEKALATLRVIPGVESAEANWTGAYASVTPNDPLFVDQWYLASAGGGAPAANIGAADAWDVTQGDASVIIAVIDTGVDWTHPDLEGRLWQNSLEAAAGQDGLDNDDNGFVDDFAGWNFDDDSNDISSASSHGTEIVGVIGAQGGNGVGIAGIAGGGVNTEGCLVMVLGVGDPDPKTSAVQAAIEYAVDNGAKVINLSFNVPRTQAIAKQLDEAEAAGVVVVAAAGNYESSIGFPASYETVIPVASIDSSNASSGFNSPGRSMKLRGIAAPGEQIQTTGLGHGYKRASGTSIAAPQVAATVGLMRSVPGGEALSAADLRLHLLSAADPLPGAANLVGAGRLNVAAALNSLNP